MKNSDYWRKIEIIIFIQILTNINAWFREQAIYLYSPLFSVKFFITKEFYERMDKSNFNIAF